MESLNEFHAFFILAFIIEREYFTIYQNGDDEIEKSISIRGNKIFW